MDGWDGQVGSADVGCKLLFVPPHHPAPTGLPLMLTTARTVLPNTNKIQIQREISMQNWYYYQPKSIDISYLVANGQEYRK